MTEDSGLSDRVRRWVGAAAEAVLDARGDTDELKSVFERTPVPMVIVDAQRRYVEVNRPRAAAVAKAMRLGVID